VGPASDPPRAIGAVAGARTRRWPGILCAAGGDRRLSRQRGHTDETQWPRIAKLYAELSGLVRSPIIELNRAVAVGMAEGPAAALAIVDGWRASPR
jgi:predicted RNA polymerase sigma factor